MFLCNKCTTAQESDFHREVYYAEIYECQVPGCCGPSMARQYYRGRPDSMGEAEFDARFVNNDSHTA